MLLNNYPFSDGVQVTSFDVFILLYVGIRSIQCFFTYLIYCLTINAYWKKIYKSYEQNRGSKRFFYSFIFYFFLYFFIYYFFILFFIFLPNFQTRENEHTGRRGITMTVVHSCCIIRHIWPMSSSWIHICAYTKSYTKIRLTHGWQLPLILRFSANNGNREWSRENFWPFRIEKREEKESTVSDVRRIFVYDLANMRFK